MVKQRPVSILVVEDDPELLLGIKEVIDGSELIAANTKYETSVITARNGRIGLDLLKNQKPDLIISDVMMPHISGFQFLETIRANPEWAHIPFIFLTARNSRMDQHEGTVKGASLYLTKPFEMSTLIEHITSQLNRTFAIQDAQEAYIASFKRQILKILNHEFRTPLTYVTAYYEMLAYKATAPEQLEEHQDYLKGIQLGCIRLEKIVEDFSLVLTLNSGELHRSFREDAEIIIDLAAIISQAVTVMQPMLDETAVSLQINTPNQLPPIIGIKKHINDIICRLLDNAIKFGKATEMETVIQLSAYTDDDNVIIKVKDNGPGMPPHVVEKIFDLFYQFNRDAREQQGTGTGLSIAAGLVNLHEGYIEVDSVDGEGSEIRVILPQNDEMLPTSSRLSDKQRVTLLIVEDDAHLLDSLQDLLETVEGKYELEVLTAVNGLDALRVLKHRMPDLIISDIMMPQMSGYDFLQEVRKRPEWLHIRFIFLTAKGKSPDKHKAYIMGVDEYVIKPYESDILLEIIEAQLNQRFLIQEMLNKNFELLKHSIINLITPTFQQPLTFVNQYVERLSDSLTEVQTMDEFKESLQGIRMGSEWLQRVVEDFMILAEFKTGEAAAAFNYQAQLIPNISIVLAEFSQMYHVNLMDEDVTLTFDTFDMQLDPIKGDISQISAIINRLIGIGRKYQNDPERPLNINLATEQADQHILIHLHFDNPLTDEIAEVVDQILRGDDPNFQLFRSFEFASELNIAQGYAELHQGKISFIRPVSDKFSFCIALPVATVPVL